MTRHADNIRFALAVAVVAGLAAIVSHYREPPPAFCNAGTVESMFTDCKVIRP